MRTRLVVQTHLKLKNLLKLKRFESRPNAGAGHNDLIVRWGVVRRSHTTLCAHDESVARSEGSGREALRTHASSFARWRWPRFGLRLNVIPLPPRRRPQMGNIATDVGACEMNLYCSGGEEYLCTRWRRVWWGSMGGAYIVVYLPL